MYKFTKTYNVCFQFTFYFIQSLIGSLHKMSIHYVKQIIVTNGRKKEESSPELIKRIADISKLGIHSTNGRK